jgi:phosphoribosylaminoimidazole-succinocarboxamide synthase
MENGFQGRATDVMPEMTDDIVESISERYIELYENITGEEFHKLPYDDRLSRIESNIENMLARLR